MRATTVILASAAVLAMGTQAQIKGQIASLDSADNYCFFLPPMVGGDIAANEDKAIAFCNKPNSRAPGAKIFPPGFVLSSHWASGKDWIQISGQIDPVQYQLNPCDTGGQYDIKAPVGATCAGYAHFVNVIEPEIGVYGMKCCQQKVDCDVSHSTYGVRRIYGAQTNFSGPRADGPLPLSLKCVNGKLPAGVAIPTAGGVASTTTSAANVGGVNATVSGGAAIPVKTGTGLDSKVESEGKITSTSAASGNNAMIAATAIVASVVGLVMA
ncbi:hypothetical protein BGZ72_007902 [Mortierella alpina]|nr:hypothetical protein BGZ72_007902 [Mortierella alpina]